MLVYEMAHWLDTLYEGMRLHCVVFMCSWDLKKKKHQQNLKYSEVRGGTRALAILLGLSHHTAVLEIREYS